MQFLHLLVLEGLLQKPGDQVKETWSAVAHRGDGGAGSSSRGSCCLAWAWSIFCNTYFIEVELIYNIVSTSSVQQSDGFSFTYILYIHFHNLSPYGSSQDIQYSPLCYTVSFYCLSTLDTYFVSPNPKAAIHPSPDTASLATTNLLSMSLSLFLLHR